MLSVNPWRLSAPSGNDDGALSQTLIGVPGLAFSAGIGFPCGTGDSGPGGCGVDDGPLNGRHNWAAHVALPPGPHATDASTAVIVTLAPVRPPVSATWGLAPDAALPRQ